MPTTKEWQDYVDKSKGTAVFVPKELEAEAQVLEQRRKAHNKHLAEVDAKIEIELNVDTQKLFIKIREYMATKGGMPDAWMKEMGWNQDALKDNQLIVHVLDSNK